MQLWPSPPTLPATTEVDDVQCPRCGNFGATVSTLWRDPATGDLFQSQPPLDTGKIVAVWVGSSVVLLVLANTLLGSDFLWLALLAASIFAILYIGVYNYRSVKRVAGAERVFQYKCRRCLHEWQWVEGHTVPRYREKQALWDDFRSMDGES
ncbi:MAG TPA: hypothetical protein VLQ48_07900 [Chloroflexia bacterium]|nr:hypothetical protein [Chloroflexia bacterium]